MDETVLPPSPNWFQVSGLAVSIDGWIVYGGPSKSLCLLEPLLSDHKGILQGPRYCAHVFNKAHLEKIVSVDISPAWPKKRVILTGSADGSVKQWDIDHMLKTRKALPSLSHEVHMQEKEEVPGVGFSNEVYAITVGSFGNVVKWDLNTNVVKTYTFCKSFKPLCMACSPHMPLNVAIGTKQGVVFVLDLNDAGKIVYKVRGQDDEIINLNWCPQYEVKLLKSLKESEKRVNPVKKVQEKKPCLDRLDASGLEKDLPDDSFEDTSQVVEEDDMFDIYKDHEADEFGHKKYQPEDIYVKVQEETKHEDFLSECLKLKEHILKIKTEGDSSIQNLVDALDKTHVDGENEATASGSKVEDKSNSSNRQSVVEASAHIHRHLLATIGKHGGIRLWSKSGKLVASCVVTNSNNKNQKFRAPYWPTLLWYKPDTLLIADGKSQLVECNPLQIDCKNKLDWSVVHSLHKRSLYSITSNAPRVQTGNESTDEWYVYTASQERNIIQYSMAQRQVKALIATCGGFVYSVQSCPYDAGKIAISVGDGTVRVWETSISDDDETKLLPGHVTSYWQNVQGKVLTVAWHPTRENLLAFATAESRIGLIDTSNKTEKPAKVLPPTLSGGIYSISWGEGNDLYACAKGDLVVYRVNKPDEGGTPVVVEVESQHWGVSFVSWNTQALVCGSTNGAVAMLEPQSPYRVQTATIVFNKMIHMIDWHPQQTSNSTEVSPNKNLLAVCSMEKSGNIVILDYSEKEDGSKQLSTYKTLSGHKAPVLQVMWNPHQEAQLLSTSQDYTVRVWLVPDGVCRSVFACAGGCMGACWLSHPRLAAALVGGADCSLRLWRPDDHPANAFQENIIDVPNRKDRRKHRKDKLKKEKQAEDVPLEITDEPCERVAVRTDSDNTKKGPKRFLLPMLQRPNQRECLLHSIRILFLKHLEKTSADDALRNKISAHIDSDEKKFVDRKVMEDTEEVKEEASVDSADDTYDFEYLKMFGSLKDVNQLLDTQMEQHQLMNNPESWITLAIFRGHIDAMIQFAYQRDMLCPYLISMAPSVSYKYWKDATQLYLNQIDRLIAKGEEKRIAECRGYGGGVFRKMATQLSVHDVKGAVSTLIAARLYKEAYLLCRTRYMDSIASEILNFWAGYYTTCGLFVDAAIIYMVLENLPQAATSLGKLQDVECLDLAKDIAKIAGQNMLVEHFAEKQESIKTRENSDQINEDLEQLPSRIELLMKEAKELNDQSKVNSVESLKNKSDNIEGGVVKLNGDTNLISTNGTTVKENGHTNEST